MKKDFVFILGDYQCDKNCPYCIAKMAGKSTKSFDAEIKELQAKIKNYQEQQVKFEYFILSGNGEPSFYRIEELRKIKELVEESKVFKDYRIQTSGKLFSEDEKLDLFKDWLKEITVVTSKSIEDQKFYHYKKAYLRTKQFKNSKRIRVNIVLLKNNYLELNNIINEYTKQKNIETIAIKILDKINETSKESIWIRENALSYQEIEKIISCIKKENKWINFKNNRFYFQSKNKKIITINYDPKNTYDDINIKNDFCWHERKIKKGDYGHFSKIEEEIEEAKDALEQENNLMYLIELSDVLGAIEGVIEKYGLTLEDLKKFSNKVKEGKKYETI